MNYKIATSFNDVLDAWCLVYRQYLAAALIRPNDFSVFTFPEYLSNNTAVILGKEKDRTLCTISAVIDGDKGLPLDSYYPAELDKMRNSGKKLIEIGLHADSRQTSNFSEITNLLAAIARFGVQTNHHDYIIGVHPRRVNFYNKVFGFNTVGIVRKYNKLHTAPVTLLHACGTHPAVSSLYINNKIYTDSIGLDFSKRFKFNPYGLIPNHEFTNSVETFIKSIWSPNTTKAA